MCDKILHRMSNEVRACGTEGLTVMQKIILLEAFIRDSRLTSGEDLAKLTAVRRWEDYCDEYGYG